MTHKFKFRIFAGVSTDSQVKHKRTNEEKDSIPDQIKTARAYGLEEGGIEVGEPFVADGYSRSDYEDLSQALLDIPALNDAVQEAGKNNYDVLILDNFDRLGDLGRMLWIRFKRFNKQLKSARRSGRIKDPTTYKASSDEATEREIHESQGDQIYRIQKIRRGWNIGVPGRVERGLHPLSLTFGYKLGMPGEPSVLIPEIGDFITTMKNMMLAGETYLAIGRFADKSGIKPPRASRWHAQVIKKILLNPFYAGIIVFGKYNHRKLTPRSNWKIGKGKHQPLWDEATYHALVAEAKRRIEGKRNYNGRYPFTGLTVCGLCGDKISRHGKPPYEYLACNTKHRHWALLYRYVPDYLTDKIVRGYKQYQSQPHAPADLTPLKKRLDEIQTLRSQIQSDREVGIYTQEEAVIKINKLIEDSEDIQRQLDHAKDYEQTRVEWESRMGSSQEAIRNLPDAIHNDDPVKVNRLLTALIKKIILKEDSVEIVWRE